MLPCHTGAGVRKDPVWTRNEKHRRQLSEMQRRWALSAMSAEPLGSFNQTRSAYQARVSDDDDGCQRRAYPPAGVTRNTYLGYGPGGAPLAHALQGYSFPPSLPLSDGLLSSRTSSPIAKDGWKRGRTAWSAVKRKEVTVIRSRALKGRARASSETEHPNRTSVSVRAGVRRDA